MALRIRLTERYGTRGRPSASDRRVLAPDLQPELNTEWAILDTFDMYSPAHDRPQSFAMVRRWFESAGFSRIEVRYGQNGVVGCGRKKACD
jgi:hypothetical protein